jgi:FlaA1/EpsC-like NDP-sugar epimerase
MPHGGIRTLRLAAIFEDYDHVFHQAALPSVPQSDKAPLTSHQANIPGDVEGFDCTLQKQQVLEVSPFELTRKYRLTN